MKRNWKTIDSETIASIVWSSVDLLSMRQHWKSWIHQGSPFLRRWLCHDAIKDDFQLCLVFNSLSDPVFGMFSRHWIPLSKHMATLAEINVFVRWPSLGLQFQKMGRFFDRHLFCFFYPILKRKNRSMTTNVDPATSIVPRPATRPPATRPRGNKQTNKTRSRYRNFFVSNATVEISLFVVDRKRRPSIGHAPQGGGGPRGGGAKGGPSLTSPAFCGRKK